MTGSPGSATMGFMTEHDTETPAPPRRRSLLPFVAVLLLAALAIYSALATRHAGWVFAAVVGVLVTAFLAWRRHSALSRR